MARSVSTHRHAVAVAYLTLPANDHNEEMEQDFHNEFAWGDFMEDLKQVLDGSAGAPGGKGFPTLRSCDRWLDREDHIILENGRCEISVSEYNGIVAVCLAPRDADCPLDVAWCERCAGSFRKLIAGAYKSNALVSQGRFSNGEQCFTLADQPGSCVTSKEGRLW